MPSLASYRQPNLQLALSALFKALSRHHNQDAEDSNLPIIVTGNQDRFLLFHWHLFFASGLHAQVSKITTLEALKERTVLIPVDEQVTLASRTAFECQRHRSPHRLLPYLRLRIDGMG